MRINSDMSLQSQELSFPSMQRKRILSWFAVFAVAAVGGVFAWNLGWLCDDIFITFRYIDQWFAGNGIVYNAGEQVEGYGHPLWLLMLAVWKLFGLELPSGAIVLGVASFCLMLAVVAFSSLKLASHTLGIWPAAAIALVFHHDVLVWGTGGLETSLFTLLFTSSLMIPVFFPVMKPRVAASIGVSLTLAILTRPDAILLVPVIVVFVSMMAKARGETTQTLLRNLIFFFAPLAIVLIPYAVWKLLYYGNLLPNTYYAKSGGSWRYGQGFAYLWLYAKGYPSSWLLVLAPLALWRLGRNSGKVWERVKQVVQDPRGALLMLGMIAVGVYVFFFVARVGGDFMYARFLIPCVPVVLLLIETSIRVLAGPKRWAVSVSLTVFALLVGIVDVSIRRKLFVDENGARVPIDQTYGIIDEHWFWTHPVKDDGTSLQELWITRGKTMGKYFDGLPVRILIQGQAAMGYYAKPLKIVEKFGLTDAYISHLPPTEPRIGHEKIAPLAYVLAQRIHFFFPPIKLEPVDTSFFRFALLRTPVAWTDAEIFVYDLPLMKELKRRFPNDVRFVDFESYLDSYLATSSERRREEIERDYNRFRLFYFYHNPDSVRENQFKRLMRRF